MIISKLQLNHFFYFSFIELKPKKSTFF